MKIKPAGTVTINEKDFQDLQELMNNEFPAVPKKKEGRFHLPVLKLNNESRWPSKPDSEARVAFVGDVATNCCLRNCCGVEGLKSACCTLDPVNLEHVLGPLDESWINMFLHSSRANHDNLKRIDVIIDYEEGKEIGNRFFPNYEVFQSEKSYPMLRFIVYGPRFVCRFLNPETGKCQIFYPNKIKDLRPGMCQTYLCQHIRANYLVRTPDKPNLLTKLR